MAAQRKGRRPAAPSSDPGSRDVVIGEDPPEGEEEVAEDATAAVVPAQAESQVPAATPTQAMAATRYVQIPMPSRGLLYDGAIPDGNVEIRKMLVGEEQIMFSSGGDTISKLNRLLNACCRLPGRFQHRDLLVSDRFFILIALRTESYGPRYKVSYRCDNCGAQNKTTLDITAELDEKQAPDDLSEPIHVDLPDAGITVGVRFKRGSDEEEAVRSAKRARLKGIEGTVEDQTFIMGLVRQLVTVGGVEVTSMLEARKVVQGLTVKDTTAIRIAIDEAEPGIDTTIYPECSNCGGVNEQQMPFDLEFFRPSIL